MNLRDAIEDMEKVPVVAVFKKYRCAELRCALFKFVDDVENVVDEDGGGLSRTSF